MTIRINTMIVVVLVTFSLLTISYLYVKSSINTTIKKEVSKHIQIDTDTNKKYDKIINEIKKIKQGDVEINESHHED